MIDSQESLVPFIDEEGNEIGTMTRREAHCGTCKLHPVVHLHVFNSKGEVYLQKRPEWKDIQPGKWDTSVGGHVDAGEDIQSALQRETQEELGITDFCAKEVAHYIFTSPMEREMVYVHSMICDRPITPDPVEITEGRFWTMDEIRSNMGKKVFTPNFEMEFEKYF